MQHLMVVLSEPFKGCIPLTFTARAWSRSTGRLALYVTLTVALTLHHVAYTSLAPDQTRAPLFPVFILSGCKHLYSIWPYIRLMFDIVYLLPSPATSLYSSS